VTGYDRAFSATAGVLAGLFLLTLLAVPAGRPGAAAGGHSDDQGQGHRGHGHRGHGHHGH
jgi:hypothetical protein